MIEDRKHVCTNHPSRVNIVTVNKKPLCWECYLPRNKFISRFGKDFYKDDFKDEIKTTSVPKR